MTAQLLDDAPEPTVSPREASTQRCEHGQDDDDDDDGLATARDGLSMHSVHFHPIQSFSEIVTDLYVETFLKFVRRPDTRDRWWRYTTVLIGLNMLGAEL